MRVLFLYIDTNSSEPIRICPGVAFLSGYLKQHNVETDLCYFRDMNDERYCLELLRERETAIVAVSSVTSSFIHTRIIIERIKNEFPEIFIICGGVHVSLFPEEISRSKGIDAICLGYGEEALLELARSVESKNINYGIKNLYFNVNGTIIRNELRAFPEELDKYFPEDRDIFYKEFNRKGIDKSLSQFGYEDFIFSRGCPFDCSYCCNHKLRMLGKGRYINYPEVDTCIDDIKQVMGRRSINRVNLHDDVLTLNKTWFSQFCKQYSKEIGLPFMCNLRIGRFTEEDVKMLKQANCRSVIIGIESGNEYIRNNVLNKNIGTNHDIINAFGLFHKYGISTASQNMIGIPGENFEKFYDTVRINAQILPNTAAINVYYPYPQTNLYKKAKEDGLLKDERQLYDLDFIERKDSVLSIPGFR